MSVPSIAVPISPRGVIVDSYFDWFNAAGATAPPQQFQVCIGPAVVNQVLFRPNGVAGGVASLYDGTSNADPLVWQAQPMAATADLLVTLQSLRLEHGVYVEVTLQSVKFFLITFRQ